MAINPDASFSRGDVMREIATLKHRIQSLETARRLESATIGRGGLRIQGGRLLAEDSASDQVFEVTTDPASIFMRQELITELVNAIVEELLASASGQDLAAFVIGQRVHAGSADGSVDTASTGYTTLSGGPTASDVPISSAGVAIVGVGASMVISPQSIGPPSSGEVGWMGYTVSGATSRSASDDDAWRLGFVDVDEASFMAGRSMTFSVQTGLNEGLHTFTAEYRTEGGNSLSWALRRVLVIGL